MGRMKPGPVPMDKEEKALSESLHRAVMEREHAHNAKVRRDMREYWDRHKRLTVKLQAAKKVGLSYGYYVALVLEKRGRL